MQTLRNALNQSEKDGVAIGHFNVADLVLLKAVVAAARDLEVPVVVGASEGEREFFGVRQIAALVHSLREEYDYYPFDWPRKPKSDPERPTPPTGSRRTRPVVSGARARRARR
jgi:hypothetical protein